MSIDRRVLHVKEQISGSEYYICVSKINEVVSIIDGMGRRSCAIYMEGAQAPVKATGFTAEDIVASCGFTVIEAKHNPKEGK